MTLEEQKLALMKFIEEADEATLDMFIEYLSTLMKLPPTLLKKAS